MGKKKDHTEDRKPGHSLREGMEEMISESEERYRTIIDEIDEGYYEVDLAGDFTFVNDSMIRQLKYSREELIGMNYRTYIPREEVEGVYKIFNRAYRTGEVIKWFPVTNIRKDGRPIFAEDSISCRRDKEGRVIGFRGISRDVTERKLAEAALRESENRYRDLVENSQDLICTHDLEGNLLSVNEAPVRALGYSREFLLQVKMKDLLTPEQHDRFEAYLKEIKEKSRASGILRLKTATGETRYWEYNNTLRTEGVAVPIVRGIAHDVTERRQAELALRESEERYRLHFENVSDVIFSYDRKFRITSISPSLERTLGYKPEEFVGKSFVDLNILPPESLEKVLSDVKRVFAGERLDSLIYKLIARDGTIKYGEFSSTPLLREGQVVAVVSVGRDITERKRAEEALRLSEEKYRLIADNSNDWIYMINPDGKFQYVSPSCERLTGYSPQEFINNPGLFLDIIHPDDQEQVKSHLEIVRKEAEPHNLEFRIITKGNDLCWIRHSCLPVRNEQGQYVGRSGTNRDITERRQAENALRASEEWFRKIFEEAHQVGIIITSPSLIFEKANPAFCRMMGYSADELRSMTFADITHPDFLKQDMENVKKVGGGEIPFYQTEKKYINKSGKVLWGNLIVSSIRDEHGALQYYLAMVIDITNQKKAVELMLEATDKYQDLAESISDVFFAMDKNLRYTYWNKASEKLTGIPAEEALGKSLMEIYPDNEARKKVKDMYLVTIETKKPQQLTVNYPGDELIVHEISSYPTMEGVSVFVRDITDRKKTEEKLSQTLENLRKAMGGIIQVISDTVETRDPYTAGHQRRTADLAQAIAGKMNLTDDQRDGLRMAGSIHDLGKISIPAEILSKPTKLSVIEYRLIQGHPQIGYDILKGIEFPWPVAEVVLQHHERLNGSGYPQGLKGQDISREARILMVADVVEAMASYRPYRPALGIEAALEEIEKNKGILYDPEVADICLKLFREKKFEFE